MYYLFNSLIMQSTQTWQQKIKISNLHVFGLRHKRIKTEMCCHVL